ncbi:MAG: 16S rRNA (cytosine(967)-C(5))-methyltransferase RsmB [Candidatus Kapaibacterium sp.]
MNEKRNNNNDHDENSIFSSARYIAVKLLNRYDRSDSYIDKLLAAELAHSDLNYPDKALLTELVNGVIRWRNKLDWGLNGFYFGDYQKCLNMVKNAMRVAFYQIMFLDRIPVPAAINESVEIVKRIQSQKTANVVNGVLRNLARNIDNIRYPRRGDDLVYHMSIIHSHPKWMVRRWLDRFGESETERLLAVNNSRGKVIIRINNITTNREEVTQFLKKNNIDFELSPYSERSVIITSRGVDMASTELFRQGKITIQDTSATMACELAAPAEGSTIYDLCAAPGGKSFLLAEISGNSGRVVAIDKYKSRLRFIDEGAQRLGLDSIETYIYDSTQDLPFDPADLVITDVPCSGLGTLSKKPDIKWKREPEDFPKIIQIQRNIMANAARMVRPGGVFLYSTCTIEPEENTGNVEWFLENYPEFEIDPAEKYLPAEVCRDGFMQTFPHIHATDGAFAARMIKKG